MHIKSNHQNNRTSPYISMITLNVTVMNSPNKDKDCLMGLKNKTQQYLASEKLISCTKTNRDFK
jgi:hypothetical protein